MERISSKNRAIGKSCGYGEGFEDRSEIYQNNNEKEQEMAAITKYVLAVWPDLPRKLRNLIKSAIFYFIKN